MYVVYVNKSFNSYLNLYYLLFLYEITKQGENNELMLL